MYIEVSFWLVQHVHIMKYFLSDCSVISAEEETVPSTKEDILGPVLKSELLEFSVTMPSHIAATDDQVFSSNEANTTAADISLKQIQSNCEDKFNALEELTDSVPQTGMD
jgi:hypothetical protein